jgi:CRP-like cAMP-binding protein
MAEEQWNPVTRKMDKARYPDLTIGTFNHWYDRLVGEGYIIVDKTRSVKMAHLVIVDKSQAD